MYTDHHKTNVYKDIEARTKGEIYIGISGPVRTGKSTFIKRFMEQLVLPHVEEGHDKDVMRDELPQSAGGKTITTTEPKFIPKDAVSINLDNEISVKVRLVDCVGYMVEGAGGHMEDEKERMVKTPWSEEEIPFTKAAEIGTRKVIRDHSTIGIVVLTDASFLDIERDKYIPAEEQTIAEFKVLKKPFIVLLNTTHPYMEETLRLAEELSVKYGVKVEPVNCDQLKEKDIIHILEEILYEFPVRLIKFKMPKWVEALEDEHPLKQGIAERIKSVMDSCGTLRSVLHVAEKMAGNEFIKKSVLDNLGMDTGCSEIAIDVDEKYYYEMLSEVLSEDISNEYQFMKKLRQLAQQKQEYMAVKDALLDVHYKGYGVVMPCKEEIVLEPPEVIKQGAKYGVRIKATSPSIHMIKANIETEIAPIVGTKEQAQDLADYIERDKNETDEIWDTNIFGKTVEQLINDGIHTKIALIGDESRMKLQETMQKIVNDSNGGMVCIII